MSAVAPYLLFEDFHLLHFWAVLPHMMPMASGRTSGPEAERHTCCVLKGDHQRVSLHSEWNCLLHLKPKSETRVVGSPQKESFLYSFRKYIYWTTHSPIILLGKQVLSLLSWSVPSGER